MLLREPIPKLVIECSGCSAQYFVVPGGGDYKAAIRVEELEFGGGATYPVQAVRSLRSPDQPVGWPLLRAKNNVGDNNGADTIG